MIRPRQDSDAAELRALYDGDVPKLLYERVLVEDGRIVGYAGIRMVPEAVLMLGKGHPAAKMRWLRTLQGELLKYVNDTGYKRIIALVAPKIERAFMRRLKSLGWLEGYQSAIYLEGDEHDDGNWRSGARLR